ncbi:hypothetical protein RHSP_76892 [Rhizobium freirei PRF 81]|uniref:Acyltransferase 3 domain-containing protein n=1 Tax=Rhizobium freirei PRF 81 TaxID=363754 RepID=N6TUU3_9HYPH|nr:acyltransferase [Rhizobium freirei]ENN84234.1 hypothetical protein RHSP_76892 [Rhizobium freirei PRF 81]
MRSIEYRGFNDALLSLRGIAACAVLMFHGMLVFKVDGLSFGPYDHTFLWFASDAGIAAQLEKWTVMLANGHAAVTFFLVHSGFVLALSMSRMTWGSSLPDGATALIAYAAKRIFRLWPMIIVSCVLAFAYQFAGHKVASPTHSTWYSAFFTSLTDFSDLLHNIALQRFNLVPFLWSLLVETYGSILMPLFYFLGRRTFTTYLLLVAFYLLSWAVPSDAYVIVNGWTFSALSTVFVFCFVIGTITAFIRQDLPQRPSWISQNALILISFIFLVLARWALPTIGGAVVIEALASAVIVYSVYYHAEGPLQWFCNLRIVKFFGLISFSLYVNSLLCIHISGQILTRLVPEAFIEANGLGMNMIAVALAAALVTVLSYLTFHFIEAPFMRAGKQISGLMEGRLQVAQS